MVPRSLPPLDEHLAVDAGTCRDRRWLESADVLQTARPRPPGAALRWLAETRAAHPGARLVAASLSGGGWAAATGGGRNPERGAVLLPYRKPYGTAPGWSLIPSLLHGWLVAGHSLYELHGQYAPYEPHRLREFSEQEPNPFRVGRVGGLE
ncbi:hypothetical protein AB0O07_34590 [Streptomyces sp. NPDC093085]|uniref:hypothetical protein n=1 Tax=Streptomyces sp. NPDC093085 TaxID=3155068 RepID=UPI00342EFE86